MSSGHVVTGKEELKAMYDESVIIWASSIEISDDQDLGNHELMVELYSGIIRRCYLLESSSVLWQTLLRVSPVSIKMAVLMIQVIESKRGKGKLMQ